VSWLKQNRPLLLVQVIATPLVIAWFLVFYFQTHSPVALVLLGLLPVSAVLSIPWVNRRRQRQGDLGARTDVHTGTVLAPQTVFPYGAPVASGRWVGAADVPGGLGRMNASTPLAVLELNGPVLTLRIRPQLLSRLFGAMSLFCALSTTIRDSRYPFA